jgi:hypothetical protein
MNIKFGECFLLHSGKKLFVSLSPIYIHADKNHRTVKCGYCFIWFCQSPRRRNIDYNSSQLGTAQGSLHSLLDYDVFSSTVTDLILIYESGTFSISVVHWLKVYSWTLNSPMNKSMVDDTNMNVSNHDCLTTNLRIIYMSSYNCVWTQDTTFNPTVGVLVCCHRDMH